jgi:hypothetical protein
VVAIAEPLAWVTDPNKTANSKAIIEQTTKSSKSVNPAIELFPKFSEILADRGKLALGQERSFTLPLSNERGLIIGR